VSISVQVLHSPDCPGAEPAAREAARALDLVGLPRDSMTVVVIEDEETANAYGMRGSPTVTVNGDDVDERIRSAPASLHG